MCGGVQRCEIYGTRGGERQSAEVRSRGRRHEDACGCVRRRADVCGAPLLWAAGDNCGSLVTPEEFPRVLAAPLGTR